MQNDRITVRFNVEDCVREQIAGYRLCEILGQDAAVQLLLCAGVIEILTKKLTGENEVTNRLVLSFL